MEPAETRANNFFGTVPTEVDRQTKFTITSNSEMGKIRTRVFKRQAPAEESQLSGHEVLKRKKQKRAAVAADADDIKGDKSNISRKKFSTNWTTLENTRVTKSSERMKEEKPDVLSRTPSANWQRFLAETNSAKEAQRKEVKVEQPEFSRPTPTWNAANWNKSMKYRNTKKEENGSPSKDPKASEHRLTRVLAMDCEMVGVGESNKSVLARVSLVNQAGQCVYDKFVRPTEPVTDYRTWVSGIRRGDLENGEQFDVVQKEVVDLINNRIVVGHALHNDFQALNIKHPRHLIRDTSSYSEFRAMHDQKTPALRALSKTILGVHIQKGEHSSVQDARATLQLYLLYRQEWEEWIRKKKKNRRRKEAD